MDKMEKVKKAMTEKAQTVAFLAEDKKNHAQREYQKEIKAYEMKLETVRET